MTTSRNGISHREGDCSARTLLRWQFKRVHEILDAAIERLATDTERRHRSRATPSAAASYAHVIVSEDLAVNGVLAGGAPLALSTWLRRTGLSELPPCLVGADWHTWAEHVHLDQALLRSYARAVFASTDAYIAAVSEDALDPARGHGPGCVLSALVLTLSMRAGQIAYLPVLGPARRGH